VNQRRTVHASTAPPAAFGRLVLNEVRLAWREPRGLAIGLGMPILLLVIFATLPSYHTASGKLGGLTRFAAEFPVVIVMVIAALALYSVPVRLAAYREQGVLRRLSTTPVSPSWLLAAQIAVNLGLATLGLLSLMGLGMVLFSVPAPASIDGLVLALVLSIAAMFAIALCIAAMAPTAGAAFVFSGLLFFPLIFFAGLWLPQEEMGAALRTISEYSPLGAAVQATHTSLQSGFPPGTDLLVLSAYAVFFGVVATLCFRWE
jgi:ABC-2 type transport system permease protein